MSRDWFVMLPGEIVDGGHLRVMGPALAVYIALRGWMDRSTSIVRVRYSEAAEKIGMAQRTFARLVSDLQDGGYIHIQQRRHHTEITVLPVPSHARNGNAESPSAMPEMATLENPAMPEMATLENPAMPTLSSSHAKNGMALNRRVYPDVCPDVKPGGGDRNIVATPEEPSGMTSPAPPPPEIGFLKFANKIHRAIHGFGLTAGRGDLDLIRGLGRSPLGDPRSRTVAAHGAWNWLRVAWVLFQTDKSRPYLRHRARTVRLFCEPGTLDDYLGPAAKRLDEAKRRRMERGRAPDTAGDLLAVHAASAPEAGRMWARMLDWLQPRILPENFQTWFEPVWAAGVTDAALTLVCPNPFYAKCLNENYLSEIVEAMRTVDAVSRRIVFTVTGDPDFKISGGGGDSQKINRSGRASEPRMGRIDGEAATAGVPSPSPAVSRKQPGPFRNPDPLSEPK